MITDAEGRTAEDRAALEAEHGPMWRWKINRPAPEVLERTIHNLTRAGFVLRPPSGWSKMHEWARPGGGSVYPVYAEDGVEYLTHHAVESYGHWLPDCPKCGLPPDARMLRDEGWCFSCNFWREIVAVRHKHIVSESNGRRTCMADGGRRSGNTSHLGFGGREWRVREIATGREFTTNNMWFQGEIPSYFYDDLPVTHEVP